MNAIWAKRIHSSSYWTGVVGALVVLANDLFGLHIPTGQVVAFAGVVASLVLSGGLVAGLTHHSSAGSDTAAK